MELDVGEVLYPGTASGHAAVVHAVLWPGLVFEHRVTVQDVWWGRYFSFAATTVAVLFAGRWHHDATQVTNTSGFTPTQVNRKPGNTVKGMLSMCSAKRCYIQSILALLLGCRAVVVCPVDTKDGRKLLAPSWLDLVQDS